MPQISEGKAREYTEEEKKWIGRLKRVMKDAPETLFMFVGGSSFELVVMPKDENGERYLNGYGMAQTHNLIHIESPIEMDGGDW